MPSLATSFAAKLRARNERETIPFLSIYQSYYDLLHRATALKAANTELQKLVIVIKHDTARDRESLGLGADDDGSNNTSSGRPSSIFTGGASANDAKHIKQLKAKIENLQDQLNAKLRVDVESATMQLKNATELAELRQSDITSRHKIESLNEMNLNGDEKIKGLTADLNNANSSLIVARSEIENLRRLLVEREDEVREIKKLNDELVTRIVTDKMTMVEEMNKMNDMIEKLQAENNMLKQQSSQRISDDTVDIDLSQLRASQGGESRFGGLGSTVPKRCLHFVKAHVVECNDICYDSGSSSSEFCATASSDSTVKVFDVSSGRLSKTLRGSGQPIMGVDMFGDFICGASVDKICRVWNMKTERCIHQLTGHGHKVTCCKFVGKGKNVLTGSADRSLKLWDINRSTFSIMKTMRHGSIVNCLSAFNNSGVSGHVDGGIRFYDLSSGERTAEMNNLHEGQITAVQFNPANPNQVLTNSRDNKLKISDMRMNETVAVLSHGSYKTAFNWSGASFSPDGRFVAAGGSTGELFVWNVDTQECEKLTGGHKNSLAGVAWGGNPNQQVATADRDGVCVLWA